MLTKIEQLEIAIANIEEAQKTLSMEIKDVKWSIKELKKQTYKQREYPRERHD